jgi:hypothetical protein
MLAGPETPIPWLALAAFHLGGGGVKRRGEARRCVAWRGVAWSGVAPASLD